MRRCSSHTPETNTISIKGGEDRFSFTSPSIFIFVLELSCFWIWYVHFESSAIFPKYDNVMQIDVCNFVTLTLHPTFLNEVSVLHLIIDFELFSHFQLC